MHYNEIVAKSISLFHGGIVKSVEKIPLFARIGPS
jgi:hypothetical protein